ncbi:MAG: STAS/SEC14 domain-containing protein [Bacteroidota bacterium]|nr:STAS/SEC14 domain-containing protein [Bacteroidota bacterium]MDP3145779.1 STAS/SEC14 domain-containing protein [Bacteroidota bacterium]MDP3556812.1 STAS/SEC14 domain-containing protein [Bacteroidota bacterium]
MNTLTPPENAIELSVFYTWMGGDGICRTKAKPFAEITLKEAKENSIAVSSFFTNKKFPLLIDSTEIKSMARDARQHFSTNGRDTKINSFAVIVKSPLSRVIGNFFMGLNKPKVPARLFDNEEDAIEWLKQYLQ